MRTSTVTITRTQRKGAYADIIDFLEHLASIYGNSTNAAANMIRQSKEYQDWLAKQPKRTGKRKAG